MIYKALCCLVPGQLSDLIYCFCPYFCPATFASFGHIQYPPLHWMVAPPWPLYPHRHASLSPASPSGLREVFPGLYLKFQTPSSLELFLASLLALFFLSTHHCVTLFILLVFNLVFYLSVPVSCELCEGRDFGLFDHYLYPST